MSDSRAPKKLFIAFVALAAFGPGSAFAQLVIPPSAEPRLPLAPIRVPEVDLDLTIPTQPRAPDRRAVDELQFAIQRITVEGSTAYSAATIARFTQPLLGQTAGLSAISGVAEAIEDRYRADGYVLTRVFVPPQRVGDGTFRIQVVEGYLDDIIFDGGSPSVQARIAAYLRRALEGRPAKLRDLERGLLLAGDLAGVDAAGTLAPGQVPGSSNLSIRIKERPLQASVTVANRASKFQGPVTIANEVSFNGLLDQTEQVTLGFTTVPTYRDSREIRYGSFRYTQPLFGDGLTIGWDTTYSAGWLGHTLRATAVHTEALRYGPRASYPIIRSRRENLSIDVSAFVSRTFTFATVSEAYEVQADEKYLAYDVRSTYTQVGFWQGATIISGGMTRGFSALDATEGEAAGLTRNDAQANFTKFSGEVRRIQILPEDFSLQWVGAWQFSKSKLYTNEEFTLGGSRFGRGYDPSEITGRQALATSVDLRYGDLNSMGWQPYVFYDHGRVWAGTGIRGELSQWQTLTSAGIGARFAPLSWLSAGLEVAKPLTRAPGLAEERKPTRYYFDITANF
jgi:hemolysin activation/secretion protein